MTDDKSIFPSSQSMGSFPSLPIPPLGEDETLHDHSRDDVEPEPEAEERD